MSASIATEHLIAGHHKNIAFIGGHLGDHIFEERLEGFLLSMKRNGLAIPDNYIVYNDSDISSIFESTLTLLNSDNPPNGIICTNSFTAVGVMEALNKKEVKIPKEVSLIAFDDYPYSSILTPAPTVIDIDLFSLGENAANLLLKKIKHPDMLFQTYAALPKLVKRQTT